MYPTYAPPPPDVPIQPLYSGPYRCGPEVVLYDNVFPDGRLLEAPGDNSIVGAKSVSMPSSVVDEPHGLVSFPYDSYVRGLMDAQQLTDLEICYDGTSPFYYCWLGGQYEN